MTILGIDPGAHGAVAVLDDGGQLLAVENMLSLFEANGRSATNAPLLAGILARTQARVAFCEFVGARPTDAKVAAFAFGRARGIKPNIKIHSRPERTSYDLANPTREGDAWSTGSGCQP
jgi:hypothetical protein